MSRILVTGMSGLVGQSVREKLAVDYELSALNRSDVDGIPTIHASLDDYEAIGLPLMALIRWSTWRQKLPTR